MQEIVADEKLEKRRKNGLLIALLSCLFAR